MGVFGGKGEYENVVLICDCLELIGFMRIVAIKEEKDGGVICLVHSGKWNKSFLKPAEAKFIVSPPIG